jgi:hypothetical protein
MEPRLNGSYNWVLVYQEFLLLLIALMGTLACLGALALLLRLARMLRRIFKAPPYNLSDRKKDDTNPARVSAGQYWDAKQRLAWLPAPPVSGE